MHPIPSTSFDPNIRNRGPNRAPPTKAYMCAVAPASAYNYSGMYIINLQILEGIRNLNLLDFLLVKIMQYHLSTESIHNKNDMLN